MGAKTPIWKLKVLGCVYRDSRKIRVKIEKI